MADVLKQHDLGTTQIIELPYVHGKDAKPEPSKVTDVVADRDRPIPGRWGILHVMARKAAFVPDTSQDFRLDGTSYDDRNSKAGPVSFKKNLLSH